MCITFMKQEVRNTPVNFMCPASSSKMLKDKSSFITQMCWIGRGTEFSTQLKFIHKVLYKDQTKVLYSKIIIK